MNRYARWFRIALLVGVLANLFFALPGIFIPNAVLDLVGGDPVIYTIWPAFASFLLLWLSLFYVLAALAPFRYLPFAVLAVVARVGGAIFYFCLWPGAYPVFGWLDLTLAVVQGLLLILALRARRKAGP